MKKNLLAIVAVALLAGPMAANAIIVTFDDLNPTVERPLSGSSSVDFFATVTLGPGEVLSQGNANYACLSPFECLAFDWSSTIFSEGHEARFRATVDSTDPTGLYDSGPIGFYFWYTDAAGETNYSEFVRYTVNVVEAASVPEPGTLALFGLGLAGIGAMRRRRASA